ncbi:hypothetical protein [Rossellomorea aquimaris]|uniref:hypothetical protein n=1 Tax=Rossellomorea aquimaris TaxID=189382 RepID=UPI0007D0724C|nr:hypothetical protein [Rossellomorea aquimaris]
MNNETLNQQNPKNEIKEIFENGLQRDLSSTENALITSWTHSFGRNDRATIINMMKELVNKHKRHD